MVVESPDARISPKFSRLNKSASCCPGLIPAGSDSLLPNRSVNSPATPVPFLLLDRGTIGKFRVTSGGSRPRERWLAIFSNSGEPRPVAYRPPTSAPMLVPASRSTGMRCSSRNRKNADVSQSQARLPRQERHPPEAVRSIRFFWVCPPGPGKKEMSVQSRLDRRVHFLSHFDKS